MPTDYLLILLIIWSVITVVLIGLLIYRGVLTTREDDELILDSAEAHILREQQELVAKINKLRMPLIVVGTASGVLALVIAGIWIWRGLKDSGMI
jgi:hypothetical protein